MPVASIANGQYALLMYVESANRSGDWYRVSYQRQQHTLGCDCAAWTFRGNDAAHRSCKHTLFVNGLLRPQAPARQAGTTPAIHQRRANDQAALENVSDPGSEHPYVQALLAQFPGIHGSWEVEERYGDVAGDGYRVVQITLQSGNGDTIQASIAFAQAHRRSAAEYAQEVAVRLGYAISLELAQRRGIRIDIRPPSHYAPQRSTTRTRQPVTPPRRTPQRIEPALPSIRFDDILRTSGSPSAGATPTERAEGTLRLLLGDSLYRDLSTNGYLDVQSVLYTNQQRVYRLRRDPAHSYDRRVRIFENTGGRMTYVHDFCIVRADRQVPEADTFLSKWLGLLSDEGRVLEVLQRYNVFNPYSDSMERERSVPVWQEPSLMD